jgi:hypothetical protein
MNLIRGMTTASLANGAFHKRCMEGTRLNVLSEAREWAADNTAPQIFWLNGVAGSGKSTVAKHLVEGWKSEDRLAGCFFFSRDSEETRTPKLFFTTIAQQGLSRLGSAARTTVALGISKLINPVSATLEDQCSSIFEAPLQAIQLNTVLVIDALDECDLKACRQLLEVLLPRLSNLPQLKVFLTSRPEFHIHEALREHNLQLLSLRIDGLENQQDVEFYMRHSLQTFPISEEQVGKLVERASGLFIFAATVCQLLQHLRGNRDDFIDRILTESLRQMDSLYRNALEQAFHSSREEDVEPCMNVLKLMVVAVKPLSPRTIDRLFRTSNSMDIVSDLRSVLECSTLDEPARFLHPTFREFLLDPQISGRFYVDIKSAHFLLGKCCLLVMNEGFNG